MIMYYTIGLTDCTNDVYDVYEMEEESNASIDESHVPPSGHSINDHQQIPHIVSSPISITYDEIIAILIALSLLAISGCILALCWRCKNRKRRIRTPNNYREYLLKNQTHNDVNVNLKRFSKNSAFEMTNAAVTGGVSLGQTQDRPISYTETLNNFDNVRSYGSAADDLETITANDFIIQNFKKNNANISPRVNDVQITNAKQMMPIVVKQEKIQNDAKSSSSCKMSSHNRGSFCGSDYNDTPIRIFPFPVSNSEHSVTGNTNNAEGYHWDCSDWVMNGSAKPIANILEVSVNEIHDSESNSDNGQIELLINDSHGNKKNGNSHDSHETSERSALLALNDKLDDIDYVDKSGPSSPQKYLDMYLPRPADNEWVKDQRRRTISDFTALELESVNLNNDDNYSVSVLNLNPDDSNVNVCEIEDDDGDYECKSVPKL